MCVCVCVCVCVKKVVISSVLHFALPLSTINPRDRELVFLAYVSDCLFRNKWKMPSSAFVVPGRTQGFKRTLVCLIHEMEQITEILWVDDDCFFSDGTHIPAAGMTVILPSCIICTQDLQQEEVTK